MDPDFDEQPDSNFDVDSYIHGQSYGDVHLDGFDYGDPFVVAFAHRKPHVHG